MFLRIFMNSFVYVFTSVWSYAGSGAKATYPLGNKETASELITLAQRGTITLCQWKNLLLRFPWAKSELATCRLTDEEAYQEISMAKPIEEINSSRLHLAPGRWPSLWLVQSALSPVIIGSVCQPARGFCSMFTSIRFLFMWLRCVHLYTW